MDFSSSNTRPPNSIFPPTATSGATTDSDNTSISQPTRVHATRSNAPGPYEPSRGSAQLAKDELKSLLGGQPVQDGGDDGVVNRLGAPALYAPASNRSLVDLSIRMAILNAESSETQKSMATDNLRVTTAKLEKNSATQVTNQNKLRDKALEQAASEHRAKVFGWVGKIAAVVAAAAAVAVTAVGAVASGGAGLPLLALSTMALVTATISLADQASQECGGPEISVTNLVSSTSIKLLEAFGVSHDDAVRIGKVFVGAAALALPVLLLIEPQMLGTLAEGICEVAGVSPETAHIVGTVVGVLASVTVGIVAVAATMLATGGVGAVPIAMRLVNGLVKGGSQLVQGGTQVAQGVMKISTAVTVKEAGYIQAENVDLQASSLILRKQIDTDQETIKDLMKNVQDGIHAAAEIIKELFESLSQISSNISRRASV